MTGEARACQRWVALLCCDNHVDEQGQMTNSGRTRCKQDNEAGNRKELVGIERTRLTRRLLASCEVRSGALPEDMMW